MAREANVRALARLLADPEFLAAITSAFTGIPFHAPATWLAERGVLVVSDPEALTHDECQEAVGPMGWWKSGGVRVESQRAGDFRAALSKAAGKE